jgi:hypothetical protein
MAVAKHGGNMIGRTQYQKVSVPLEGVTSSQGVSPNDSSIQDSEDKPIPRSLGVANAQDGFENAQSDNSLEKIGLGTKSIVDPIVIQAKNGCGKNSSELA